MYLLILGKNSRNLEIPAISLIQDYDTITTYGNTWNMTEECFLNAPSDKK